MTTPNHGFQGSIISWIIWPTWYHVVIAIILSILPDLSIAYQRYILRRKFPDEINWNDGWYDKFHQSIWALFIPYTNIHVIEDRGVHDEINGGKNEYYNPTEYALWGYIVPFLIYIIYQIIVLR